MKNPFAGVWRGAARSAKSRWRSLPRRVRVPLVALAGFAACVLAVAIFVAIGVAVGCAAESDDPATAVMAWGFLFLSLMTAATIYVDKVYDV